MKKPYFIISILKTKFFQTVAFVFFTGIAFAQSGQKYSTGGNILADGDKLGSTNNQSLSFITNNQEAVKILPDGKVLFRQDITAEGAVKITAFAGTGLRLISTDNSGLFTTFNFSNDAADVLLGNGTFVNFNQKADARVTNFFSGLSTQITLGNGTFTDAASLLHEGVANYFTGAANQVVTGEGQFADFSDMLETGLHDFGLYYSHGNLGVGTTTPSSTLDVAGDLTVHGRIFLVEGTTKSLQVETEEVITKTVEAEERIAARSFASQELRSEVIQMDSQTKIVGETNVEGSVNVSETMTIGGLYAMEEEQPQQPTLPPPAPTFRLNVFGGTSITGNAFISNKLGLGVESPTERLDVLGNAKLSGNMTIDGNLNLTNVSDATDAAYNLVLSNNGTVYKKIIEQQQAVSDPWVLGGNSNISDADNEYFGTKNYFDLVMKTNGNEHMRISKDGNIGIGTASPSHALHIAGGNLWPISFAIENKELATDNNVIRITAEKEHSIIQSKGDILINYYNGGGTNVLLGGGYNGTEQRVNLGVTGKTTIGNGDNFLDFFNLTNDPVIEDPSGGPDIVREPLDAQVNIRSNYNTGLISDITYFANANQQLAPTAFRAVAKADEYFIDGQLFPPASGQSTNTTFSVKSNGDIFTAGKIDVAGIVDADGYKINGQNLSAVVAQWTANIGEWTKNGSNIYRNNGYVGIGTSSPQAPLHVSGAGNQFIDISSTDGVASYTRLMAVTSNNKAESQLQYKGLFSLVTPLGGSAKFTITENGITNINASEAGAYALSLTNTAGGGHGLSIVSGCTSCTDNYAIDVVNNNGERNFLVTQKGNVYARQYVASMASFPDYVFKADYKLMSLDNLNAFITKEGHLPGVPKEEEVVKSGIDLAQMQKIQMEKIEELTLYIIELKKEIELMKQNKSE